MVNDPELWRLIEDNCLRFGEIFRHLFFRLIKDVSQSINHSVQKEKLQSLELKLKDWIINPQPGKFVLQGENVNKWRKQHRAGNSVQNMWILSRAVFSKSELLGPKIFAP